MNFSQFKLLRNGDPALQSQTLDCHIGYSGPDSFNCQLTTEQAIALAKQLKRQARILSDHGVDGGAVHLWWKEKSPSRILCGTHGKTKSPGRNRKKAASR
jgi:hypothetical protein